MKFGYCNLPQIAFSVYFVINGRRSYSFTPSASLSSRTIRRASLLKTSTNSRMMFQWKAGVRIFRRLCHLLPVNARLINLFILLNLMLPISILDNDQTCAREKSRFEPRMKKIVETALGYVSGTYQKSLRSARKKNRYVEIEIVVMQRFSR